MKTFSRLLLYSSLLAVAWVASIACGMRILARTESNPAQPLRFPQNAALTLATDRPTLILLADPHNAGAHASLTELALVMAELGGKAKAYVVFASSADGGSAAERSALWNEALAIPGVIPVGDEDGTETRRFAGNASAHALVFAQDGQLLGAGPANVRVLMDAIARGAAPRLHPG